MYFYVTVGGGWLSRTTKLLQHLIMIFRIYSNWILFHWFPKRIFIISRIFNQLYMVHNEVQVNFLWTLKLSQKNKQETKEDGVFYLPCQDSSQVWEVINLSHAGCLGVKKVEVFSWFVYTTLFVCWGFNINSSQRHVEHDIVWLHFNFYPL